MRDVVKSFGAVRALDGVSFDAHSGEVHALAGENGAGKSTLMKVLSGALRPDAGSMTYDGAPYAPRMPRDARKLGVAMIYQELSIAPHLTVEANVMLGQEATTAGIVRRRDHDRRVRDALALLDHPDIRPSTPASQLSLAAQQLVEVARALVSDARLIVFDEPTGVLPEADAQRLFHVINRLRKRGIAIVYISHFLEEIQRLADRVTVLRDGRSVGAGLVAGMPLDRIITLMVGRSIDEMFPIVDHHPGPPLLSLEALAGGLLPHDASLTLHRGEILGIAGLVGAGRTELLRALFALEPVRSGQIRIAGIDRTLATPRARVNQGFGYLSEDRKGEGLALSQSIEDNLTYSRMRPYTRLGWVNLPRRRGRVLDAMRSLSIRAAAPDQPVAQLSGGNQQKVALARLLHQEADILLLDEPTRGIDVASKVEIYRAIGALAAQRKAILVVSSYLPELLGICDRIAVMHRGTLGEALPTSAWTQDTIMSAATGA
jgi:ribose transport system ATP-binding protein